jgi:epoxyqueuosine reductase QueG
MIDSKDFKDLAHKLGTDLCGIAPVERFRDAPAGFHPTDIYKNCKSVVVFAKRLPTEALFAASCVPYTHVNAMVTLEVDMIAVEYCRRLETGGVKAVPIPSDDPYEYWERDRTRGQAILSMRHAGYLAGLGVLGKNTLLVNRRFGNMIQIGAVLVDADLEGDPVAAYQVCPDGCTLCMDSCPANALDGVTVDQHLCRPLACFKNGRGFILKKCSLCRSVCPSATGLPA